MRICKFGWLAGIDPDFKLPPSDTVINNLDRDIAEHTQATKDRLGTVDIADKQRDRERVKAKHWAQRQAARDAQRRDNSSDDDEGVADFHPTPTGIFSTFCCGTYLEYIQAVDIASPIVRGGAS
jgi:hypothetical protein